MFFFDVNDAENWFTEDHYTQLIRPLKNLVFETLEKIRKNYGLFDTKTENKIIDLPDWGEFNSVKGFDKKIMNEQWSGIELRKTLKIFKQNKCCKC